MTEELATKVTMDSIVAKIKSATYTILPNLRTTVCQITLENGFTVEGQSACVSAKNFDIDEGVKFAYKDAVNNIWKFEGYLLAEKLYQAKCN